MSETDIFIQTIDLEILLKNKRVPKFIIRYLKRLVHQDELNQILTENYDKQGLDLIAAGIKFLGAEYTIVGNVNIPQSGTHIFIGNHPMGGLEGIIYFKIIGDRFKQVKSLSNDILLNINNLKELLVPIKVGKAQTKEYARLVDDLYSSENQVLIFPAGLVSRKRNGKIEDLVWKKSFVTKAIQYKRDIVPSFISGKNSDFFYSLANLRKFFKIKLNIEMLFLPDELFKQRNFKQQFTFGKAISWQLLDKRFTHDEWAQLIKRYTYTLKDKPQLTFEAFLTEIS